jgi:hypothetical protein
MQTRNPRTLVTEHITRGLPSTPCFGRVIGLKRRASIVLTVSRAIALAICLVAGAGLKLQGASIFVPNSSFESQVAGPPYGVDTRIDSWQKSPKPAWFDETAYGILWDQTMGVFANTPSGAANHIDNMTGNQGAYMFALPQVAIFQDYNSLDWNHSSPSHDFNATFDAGKSYQLTVGLIGGGGGMTLGSTFELSLYYRDSANNMITIAATPVTYTAELFPSTTHFVDFSVNLGEVQAGDAWAGKNIGIELASTYGTAGYWDLDNVRLTSAVPEPAALSLSLLGILGLVAKRRLKG